MCSKTAKICEPPSEDFAAPQAWSKLKSEDQLTDKNIKEPLKDIRRALLVSAQLHVFRSGDILSCL